MSDLRSTVRTRRIADRVAARRAAMTAAVDALEPRQLFSGNADLTTVTFRGHTGQAIAGNYVVVAGPNVDFAAVAAKAGFTNVKDLGGAGYYFFHTDKTPQQVSKWAAGRNGILSVGPDYVTTPAAKPNDPYYTYQYLTNNTGQVIPNPAVPNAFEQQAGTAGADMNLEAAWDITTGDSSQIVAVIDSGIDVTHGDLIANLWTNPGESGIVNGVDLATNGIDDDGNGFADDVYGANAAAINGDLTDTDGHGTAVAGVIAAAGNNLLGVAGVSWSTKIMAVKVFDDTSAASGSLSSIVTAINYIVEQKRRGFNIVAANASLGTILNQTVQIQQYIPALRTLNEAGIVFVTASGNEGADLDNFIFEPQRTAFATGNTLIVGATDNRDQIASFSNYGAQTVDVAAPGVQVFTTTSKDAVIDALGNRSNNLSGYPVVYDNLGNPYVSIDGTSFSSPAVAGVVALAKAAYPSATPAQIVAAIKAGADRIPALSPSTSPNPLVETGGRVDAYNTLRILGNQFVSQNSTLQGNFIGKFGGRSALVYGSDTFKTVDGLTSSQVPAPATVVQGKLKKNSATGLLTDNAGNRSAGYLESAEPISYTFDFGGNQRRVTFYVADIGSGKGSETFTVTDNATGAVLASTDVNDYRDGRYVSFDLSGAVTVKVTPTKGNAIVNGIFVDNAPTGVPFVQSRVEGGDGNFLGVRGDQGFVIPGGSSSPASYATVSSTGAIVSGKAPKNSLLLETLTSSKVRSGAAYSGDTFDINVTFTDAKPHEVSFYTSNLSKTARAQRISVLDSAGNVITSQDVTVAKSGAYTTFTVSSTTSNPTSKTVTFRVTSLGGGPASVQGVFFSASVDPDVSYVGTDTTTGGQYRGKYGNQGFLVFGIDAPPTYTGTGSIAIIDADTNKKNALQNPTTSTGNIAAYLQTQNSIEFKLSPDDLAFDGSARRLSLYFADYDKKGRVQQVEVLNSAGEVVSKQILREFTNGKYLTYDVQGDVTIRLTRIFGPTAVVSGVFVD